MEYIMMGFLIINYYYLICLLLLKIKYYKKKIKYNQYELSQLILQS